MRNFLKIITGPKTTPKETAEAFVELELEEPEFRQAVEVAEKEVIRFNQARLSGVKAPSDEVSKATKNLETARLDLQTIQNSKIELRAKLEEAIKEERKDLVSKMEAIRPEAAKESEKIKKVLAEKIIEVQVLFDCLKGYWDDDILNIVSNHFRDSETDSQKPYLDMIEESKKLSIKRINESAMGRLAALENLVAGNNRDSVESVANGLLDTARKTQGAAHAEEEKKPAEPALN